ncbi:hypothetical protein NHQ30_004155 [Ciborinia camelliae]|nr:hypothetical protein NHQ30_004155 [Ciborinia camelliae]
MPNVGNAQLGTMNSDQCDGTLNNYAGCGATAQDGKSTYGESFNSNGGGIYATEWTSDHIKIWFFPRNATPHDIRRDTPDPNSWPKPQAIFQGSSSCDIDGHFANQSLVFDTTFCGDFAGGVWGNDGGVCSQGGKLSCQQFVAGNPGAFGDAYWLINSIKVYQLGDRPINLQTPTITSTTTRNIASLDSESKVTTQTLQLSRLVATNAISEASAISRSSSTTFQTIHTLH